jgi:hypothetical protein
MPTKRTVDAVLVALYKRLLVLQLEPLLKMPQLARLELVSDDGLFRNKDLVMEPTAAGTWSKLAIVEYLAAIFPGLTALLDAGCKIEIEVVRRARFEVKKEELTVQHWITKIWGAESN